MTDFIYDGILVATFIAFLVAAFSGYGEIIGTLLFLFAAMFFFRG